MKELAKPAWCERWPRFDTLRARVDALDLSRAAAARAAPDAVRSARRVTGHLGLNLLFHGFVELSQKLELA
jgi:hypothetical protein